MSRKALVGCTAAAAIALWGASSAHAVRSATPTSVDFGIVKLGTQTAPRSVAYAVSANEVSRAGVNVSIVSSSAVPFFTQTNNCPGSTFPPGDQLCTISVNAAAIFGIKPGIQSASMLISPVPVGSAPPLAVPLRGEISATGKCNKKGKGKKSASVAKKKKCGTKKKKKK